MLHKHRWTAEKIAQRIDLISSLVYRRRLDLPPFRFQALPEPLAAPPVGPEIDDSGWPIIAPKTYWGEWEQDFVLRMNFDAPESWGHTAPVALFLPLSLPGDTGAPEALVFIDGVPYAGCDRNHAEIRLPERWRDGKPHLLALHGWTGRGAVLQAGEAGVKNFMRHCALVQIDQPTRDFLTTARIALSVATSLDENEPAKGNLLNALDAAFRVLDTVEPFDEGFYASIPAAHHSLREGIAVSGHPLDVEVVAAGHAHIDTAWLWTLGQTRRKAGRTFHTVLRLMEQFPEYYFTQSQPQLYDYIRQDYPALFEAIKQRVAEGRWEPIGGMWIEADCNLTGPESLARQFLLGRGFFRKHFGSGAESPVLWLPDVFGYAWALPQLIKQAGMDYFFTIKIGWNQYNRLPYDTFWWEGLDGTRVLTHFSSTPGEVPTEIATYNAKATPAQTIGTWTNFQQKELQRSLLMAYGFGDGGGGPTREMLENLREMAAFPATPQVRPGRVIDFYRKLEAESGDRLSTWKGELYLEYHRGTYTTQSRNKRFNRKSEFLLHDAEFAASLASILDSSYRYPAEAFDRAWELVCLNQFHDIIPGSSVAPVYEESARQYAEVRRLGEEARDGALAAIAGKLGRDLLIVNPTGFRCADLAFWPEQVPEGERLIRTDGVPVHTQPVEGGTLIAVGDVPPLSVIPFALAAGSPVQTIPNALTARPGLLENAFLRVEFNAAGDITRIFDKGRQREVLAPGGIGNQFQAFENRPMKWEAWDIDIFYDDRLWISDPAASIRAVEAGPLRVTMEIRRRILHSDYVQRISLFYNSPRLDFDTWIDWRERHILLKVAFPVDILAANATYEVQWGNVERPTHRNTSWDWARFETCAQKWVDLSESDYGVSLLNDCKYGHDIQNNVMRMTLLNSPTQPDPEADQGEHRFAYSLLPHAGRWGAETIAAAYAFNDPLIPFAARNGATISTGEAFSLVQVDRPDVVVETIKRAADGNGLIVRLYESQRQRGRVTLTAGFKLADAWRTNLLEENQARLEVDGRAIQFSIRPYEIVTLRLVPGGPGQAAGKPR